MKKIGNDKTDKITFDLAINALEKNDLDNAFYFIKISFILIDLTNHSLKDWLVEIKTQRTEKKNLE